MKVENVSWQRISVIDLNQYEAPPDTNNDRKKLTGSFVNTKPGYSIKSTYLDLNGSPEKKNLCSIFVDKKEKRD